MTKGAGMIQPDMATMLAFIATDAEAGRSTLASVLKSAVAGSFNAITVDGDMSTNDCVILMANGASGVRIPASRGGLRERFAHAVQEVCSELADMIVADGERITKVVEIRVSRARSGRDAEKIARAIGNSLLVKSSWFGNDPNWGRIVDAAGYSGVTFRERDVDLSYSRYPSGGRNRSIAVLKRGSVIIRNEGRWKEIVMNKRFTITIAFNSGKGSFRLLATDITEGYVRYNKSE